MQAHIEEQGDCLSDNDDDDFDDDEANSIVIRQFNLNNYDCFIWNNELGLCLGLDLESRGDVSSCSVVSF